jgi:hypothetical protein
MMVCSVLFCELDRNSDRKLSLQSTRPSRNDFLRDRNCAIAGHLLAAHASLPEWSLKSALVEPGATALTRILHNNTLPFRLIEIQSLFDVWTADNGHRAQHCPNADGQTVWELSRAQVQSRWRASTRSVVGYSTKSPSA